MIECVYICIHTYLHICISTLDTTDIHSYVHTYIHTGRLCSIWPEKCNTAAASRTTWTGDCKTTLNLSDVSLPLQMHHCMSVCMYVCMYVCSFSAYTEAWLSAPTLNPSFSFNPDNPINKIPVQSHIDAFHTYIQYIHYIQTYIHKLLTFKTHITYLLCIHIYIP
jgi:hypothetical protein